MEEAYGASVVFRGILKKALSDMMRDRGMGEQRAAEVAVMIMRTNAAALFDIDLRAEPDSDSAPVASSTCVRPA